MRDRREWTRQALCLGRDPGMYELEEFRGDREKYARGACVGCPVIGECAADALDPLAVGTVRAGVWISEQSSMRRAARRQLIDAAARARADRARAARHA